MGKKLTEAGVELTERELRLFADAGLLDGAWINVLEHSKAVATFALWLVYEIAQARLSINIEVLRLGALFHDADKRLSCQAGVGYADEHNSRLREDLLEKHGYDFRIQKAAKYAGRVPHMFRPASEWVTLFQKEPIEHLLVGYADARVRGIHIVSLTEACRQNCAKRPQDQYFYKRTWMPFYQAIERFLSQSAAKDLSEEA